METTKNNLTDNQRDNIIAAFKKNEDSIIDALIVLFMDSNIIEDQLVTAIEGGINYWGGIDNRKGKCIIPEGFKKEKDEPLSIWCSRLIKEGGAVKFYDIEESEDDSEWFLDLNKMVKGFMLMATKSTEHFANMIIENGDAETADVYIQYCLLGEIVFG